MIYRALAIISGVVAFVVFFTLRLQAPLEIPLRAEQHVLRAGFYPAEMNGEQMFAWTGPHAEFTVPAIDRRKDWRVTLDTRIWRPAGVPMPRLRIDVDGVTVADQMLTRDLVLAMTVPRRPDVAGMTVKITTTPPFVPGRDRRQLGVAIASIMLEPTEGTTRAPWPSVVKGAAAIAILGTAIAMLPLPPAWIATFAIVVSLGQASLFARGMAPYLGYPAHVLVLAACLGLGWLAMVRSLETFRRQRLSRSARCVAALCLAACYLKLLMLLHPSMPIGDGVFHAHRFEYVLAGRFYFTSLTPDNYAFPYPIFLYFVSAPFAWLTSDTFDRLAVLRIVVTVADAAAAALLYWMIVRATSDKLAGIACVVWYHIMPMTAWIMTWGALTNAFAQTLFVASLALVVALPVERNRRSTVVILALIAAAALLTHPSTCAILVSVLGATSALYAWRGGTLRDGAIGVAVAAALASVAAVVLYYAWFPSVYISEIGRAASASALAGAAPTTSLGARLAKTAWLGEIYFGWPASAVAAIGAWRLSRNDRSPRLTLLLVGWAGVCVVFLAIGIVTPIEMRYHFAAFPALAIAAAFACSWAWRSRAAVRFAISALVLAGVWDGVAQWIWAMSTYARLVR